MSKEMSRRDLLKMSGLAAAGVAGASLLGGCAPKAASSASDSGKAANGGSTAATTAAGHERAGLPSFLSAPEPIKDVKTTCPKPYNRIELFALYRIGKLFLHGGYAALFSWL